VVMRSMSMVPASFIDLHDNNYICFFNGVEKCRAKHQRVQTISRFGWVCRLKASWLYDLVVEISEEYLGFYFPNTLLDSHLPVEWSVADCWRATSSNLNASAASHLST
jgi:hypothetical protein